MSLTLGGGPLAAKGRGQTNYEIEGPKNKILFAPFPRRVRAMVAGETVLDTDRGMLLHETNILPQLYVPMDDVRSELLTATEHSTHCPYKGDASYWTITVGDDSRENAVWGYPNPTEGANWLAGYVALYWNRVDTWLDEDEEVRGHLADPYHRVDIRLTTREVTVTIGRETVARSTGALVLSETGLPNRFYIPADDIQTELFSSSATTTHCPYKGDTEYWSVGSREDVAWSYPSPFNESAAIAGYWSFLGDDVDVVVTTQHD